jgi:hypothetical protein
MAAQVLRGIGGPVLEIVTQAANRAATACSTFNTAKSSPEFYVDVLTESERIKYLQPQDIRVARSFLRVYASLTAERRRSYLSSALK